MATRTLFRLSLSLALLAAAPAAEAQADLQIALTPSLPPLTNGTTHALPSSVSFDVTNARAGTRLRQIDFTLPSGYVATGGAGPAGWTALPLRVNASTNTWKIRFRVVDCSQTGVASGSTGTFRLDATSPTSPLAADTMDELSSVIPSDPCGGAAGWTNTPTDQFMFPRKVLSITAAASPASGASPLSVSVPFVVTNRSSAAKSGVTIQTPIVTASEGAVYAPTGCSPASVNLNAGASGTITCGYTLTSVPGAGSEFTFASTASGPSATSVGVVSGAVQAGGATATFAFDSLMGAPGDQVRATLSVKNNSALWVFVMPPTYAELALQGLSTTGASNPGAKFASAGQTVTFVYTFTVSGAVSSTYSAAGTADTWTWGAVVGPTNMATTPAGRVSSARVNWAPSALVKARTTAPYRFTVTVTNLSADTISEIDIVNPQNNTWTGLANVAGSTMTPGTKRVSGTTDTLPYTGTLAVGATATLNIQFTAIPTVAITTIYTFRVGTISSTTEATRTYDQFVVNVAPIGEVGGLGILSTATSQLLTWTNTSRADAAHDGVVVFRATAPAVPASPVDGTDYTGDPSALYADAGASSVTSLEDPVVGVYNYRVCNHDANLVYSNCNTGFWNNAGWLDSVVAPVNGWSHNLGGQMLLRPGVIPGSRMGIASNAPAANVLDISTGQKAFPAVSLPALPSVGSPMAQMDNGRRLLIVADQSGTVTAVDVDSGMTYWSAAKTGESFTAGVSGIIRRYAPVPFQAAYHTDVLFLGSTSGRLFAVDASTGATIWTVTVGTSIRALVKYDSTKNWIYVPTDGGGIVAYDLATSNDLGVPPALASGWVNPGGSYSLACTGSAQLACADRSGLVRILDKSTGSVIASGASALTSPSSITSITGGVVVSNASRVVKLVISGSSLTVSGTWTPGSTLSPALVYQSVGSIYVTASDKKLHKLSIASMTETTSVSVASQSSSVFLGPPNYDVTNNLFLFGSSDGHLWAVKYF